MAERMIVKFDKYWEEYSVVLAFAIICDPRVKLETLCYCYEQIDPLTWETKLENLKDKLYNLFSQYSAKSSTTSDVNRSSVSSSSTSTKRPHFDTLKKCKLQIVVKMGRNQLDVYLDEPTLDLNFTKPMDVLRWWRSNNEHFS